MPKAAAMPGSRRCRSSPARPCRRARRRPSRAPGRAGGRAPHHGAQKSTTTGHLAGSVQHLGLEVGLAHVDDGHAQQGSAGAPAAAPAPARLRRFADAGALDRRRGRDAGRHRRRRGDPGRARCTASARRAATSSWGPTGCSARGHRVDRLRRARPRRLVARAGARTPTATTSSRADLARACSTRSSSSARCSPARRWARTRSCASRSTSPSASPGSSSITPAYDPVGVRRRASACARYDALAEGLRSGGVEGYLDGLRRRAAAARRWRDVGRDVRAPEHRAPRAPRARSPTRCRPCRARGPFEDLHALEQIECPAVVVASRDEADPGHPLALGEAYAELLPHGRLVVEEEGSSPLAWQGGRLSKVIAELAAEAW